MPTAAEEIAAAAAAAAKRRANNPVSKVNTGYVPRPPTVTNPAPGDPMGTESTRGGRTRRRFKKHRLMSRKYCKKTPCRRMGFTQKASCRPYKNCYTRRK